MRDDIYFMLIEQLGLLIICVKLMLHVDLLYILKLVRLLLHVDCKN